MRFLIIGCGSVGERHLRNLISLKSQVIACDLVEKLRKKIEGQYKVKSYLDYKEALSKEKIDAVLVCTPACTHIPIARSVAEKGYHLFIEKPIAHNLDGLDLLINLVKEKNLVLLAGCNMRFHMPLRIIKDCLDKNELGRILSIRAYFGHYLPNWRPSYDYRKSYSADASQGGILLDGIHEIDCLTWLAGEVKRLFCSLGKVSDLEINAEDLAELIFEFENGAVGQIHLDYLRHNKYRFLEVIGDKGTVFWQSEGKLPEAAKVVKSLHQEKENLLEESVDTNKMYLEEMKHFVNCLKGSEVPVNDAEQAKKTLELVLRAKDSSKNGTWL